MASEDGELRATLILDEISEYYEKDEDAPGGGQKYYKVCDLLSCVTFSLSLYVCVVSRMHVRAVRHARSRVRTHARKCPTHLQIMVHLYNSGFEPICDATLSLSETAEVEQAWTVEQVCAPLIEHSLVS